jgi:hypothetical protein
MPLDADTLKTAIKAAFGKAKATPPPQDPKDTDKVQETILDTLSQDLAAAIDAYVKAAQVAGVKVQVLDPATHQPLEVGQQTPALGFGKLQ